MSILISNKVSLKLSVRIILSIILGLIGTKIYFYAIKDLPISFGYSFIAIVFVIIAFVVFILTSLYHYFVEKNKSKT